MRCYFHNATIPLLVVEMIFNRLCVTERETTRLHVSTGEARVCREGRVGLVGNERRRFAPLDHHPRVHIALLDART